MKKPLRGYIMAQIFLIFILPVMLLYFKIVSDNWRMVLLMISALIIYGIIRHENWTHKEMGVRYDNIKKAFPYYLFFTVLGFATLIFLGHKVGMPDIDTEIFFIKTFVLFLPISFFQEFTFRSFLMTRLQELFKNQYYIIFINALLFTLMHIIYPSLGIILPMVFVSGVLFAWLYLKYPNLILISISHAILNVTAVLLGFFYLH